MTQSVEAPPKPYREGLYFEDFELGQVLWSSRRTVTEGEISVFAGLSGDYTALHVDEEFAKKSPFRGRIAHGMLVWSIAGGLAYQTGAFDGTVDALAGMGMDFTAPVYPGDTIQLRLEVTSKAPEPSPRNGLVVFQGRVFNQKDRMTVDGELRMLIRRRRRRARGAPERP